jgi:hypothetical protein
MTDKSKPVRFRKRAATRKIASHLSIARGTLYSYLKYRNIDLNTDRGFSQEGTKFFKKSCVLMFLWLTRGRCFLQHAL